jgi:hypothetical protein
MSSWDTTEYLTNSCQTAYNDSTFLNTLHGHVNAWIKSIQSVTKLNRDVASGTASQEINFWLTFERALEGIEAQLRSDEVNMVSFIADTRLKDATDQGESLSRNAEVAQVFPPLSSAQIQSTNERLSTE